MRSNTRIFGSWGKITFEEFAGLLVGETPGVVSEQLPVPGFGRRDTGKRARKVNPVEARGWSYYPRIGFIVEHNMDLPGIAGGLGDHKGQGSFGELHEAGSVRTCGHQQFTGDFRSFFFGTP